MASPGAPGSTASRQPFPGPTAGPRWHDPAQHGHLAQRSQGCHRWNPISVAFVTVVLTGWLVLAVRAFRRRRGRR